jgi:hypothetical protein
MSRVLEVTHVKFGNSQQVAVTSATDTQVAVRVPANAETGLVTVVTPAETKTSATTFTVTPPTIEPPPAVVQVDEVQPPEGPADTV